MNKRVKELVVGEHIENMPLFFSKIAIEEKFKVLGQNIMPGYVLTLQDITGQIRAFIPQKEYKKEYNDMKDKVVLVSGTILTNNGVYIKVDENSLKIAQKGDFKTYDIAIGLPTATNDMYAKRLIEYINQVKKKEYKDLLLAVFTAKDINPKIRRFPASLTGSGNYEGGLLAETVTVTHMCKCAAQGYNECLNSIYSNPLDEDLLITAALLHGVAKVRMYTKDVPYQKTSEGILKGELSLMIEILTRAVLKAEVEISEEDLSMIINILVRVLDEKSRTKEVLREAVVLQRVLDMYRMCDIRDRNLKGYSGERDIFYSETLSGYVYNMKGEKDV